MIQFHNSHENVTAARKKTINYLVKYLFAIIKPTIIIQQQDVQ